MEELLTNESAMSLPVEIARELDIYGDARSKCKVSTEVCIAIDKHGTK